MIDLETLTRIRQLYYGEHWRVGTIAAELGLHHATVEGALRDEIEAKVLQAYQQRTGRDSLPSGLVTVNHFNGLMWQLRQAGLWEYQRIADGALAAAA